MQGFHVSIDQDYEIDAQGRPVFKTLPSTTVDKILNVSNLIIFIATWIYVLTTLPTLPDSVDVDCSTLFVEKVCNEGKNRILISPCLTIFTTIVFQIAALYPHRLLIRGVRITIENAAQLYVALRIYLRYVNMIILIVLLLFSFLAVRRAKGLDQGSIWMYTTLFIGGSAAVAGGYAVFRKYVTT